MYKSKIMIISISYPIRVAYEPYSWLEFIWSKSEKIQIDFFSFNVVCVLFLFVFQSSATKYWRFADVNGYCGSRRIKCYFEV